jgi:hypothetical protein
MCFDQFHLIFREFADVAMTNPRQQSFTLQGSSNKHSVSFANIITDFIKNFIVHDFDCFHQEQGFTFRGLKSSPE